MRHIAIDLLLLPAACAHTIDDAFSKRMGILQEKVKARGESSNVPKTLFAPICISFFIKSMFLKKLRREKLLRKCNKVMKMPAKLDLQL